MAVNPKRELIWQGRLHLGDEPGIYGDAHYCGGAIKSGGCRQAIATERICQ